MPVETKIDLFKPQQPEIPGVPSGGGINNGQDKTSANHPSTIAASRPEKRSRLLVVGAGLALFVVCLVGGGLLYLGRRVPSGTKQTASPAAVTNPEANLPTVKTTENLPVAPGPIATTSELAKDWSAKRFLFADPVTNQLAHAMVVRLPGGTYWGFSLREPFGTCELELVTDLQKLSTAYQLEARHPMVGNPCNRTVYDLMRYGGGAPNDGLVRGEIVQGSGLRPPMAIEIRVRGKQIFTGRTE